MATTTRVRKTAITNVTHEAAVSNAKTFAATTHRLQAIEAQMNTEITQVRQRYEVQLTELAASLKAPLEVLEVYARENKDTWKKKSLDLLHCIVGYRTSTPAVAKDKKFTWDGVVELLKKAGLKKYIRTKEEINKEAILAEGNPAMLNQLAECYVSIKQEEVFFVEAKTEGTTL